MKAIAITALIALSLISPLTAWSENEEKPHHVYEGSVTATEVDAFTENDVTVVQWDKWRNRLLHAAWKNWGERIDGGVSFGLLKLSGLPKSTRNWPNGMKAIFRCTVARGRRIEDLKIVESSGDPEFDEIVLDSVRALDGKSVLEFPRNSKRDKVQQSCMFRIAKTAFHEQQFGDSERAPSDGG